jgi:ABC-type transporter lipoprotein component MlaA
MVARIIRATILLTLTLCAAPARGSDEALPPPGAAGPYYTETYSDPLAPFNEKMFWFNLKLDKYVLHPVAAATRS